jgi:class 3 adenylate cyclase
LPYPRQKRSWTWQFPCPPEPLWQQLGDTQRFNEAAGLPKQRIHEVRQPDGSLTYHASARQGPFALEWQEIPVNWVANSWFEHCRHFTRGPLKLLCARLFLRPLGAGSELKVEVEAQAANLFGVAVLKGGFFKSCEKMYGTLAEDAARFVQGEAAMPFAYEPPKPSDEARGRASRLAQEIEASGHGHGLAQKLITLIFAAQEVDLMRLRPLRLARDWQAGELDVIELCLASTRAGLLDLRWDLLCPRCRIGKAGVQALDRLPQGAHCETCDIDYDRDFSKNVELSFTPAASLRPVTAGEFCLFGPMSTPHIWIHVTLAPGALRNLDLELPAGVYRLRSLEPGPQCEVDFAGGGFPRVILDETEVTAGPAAAPGQVALENRSGRPLTVVVEERQWLRDALTADRVTSLQAFRDLFSEQVLRPGDEVAVARVALMFTDIKGSTSLFNRIGDAAAYHLVREHFAFLAAIVRDNRGAVVKTIGDAIMASFADPADGLRAALAIQQRIGDFNRAQGGAALSIKLGLHLGATIVVTLNGRLDYFGATVNMAARLQGASEGGDIVLSQELAEDPVVAGLLAGVPLQKETTRLKGFDEPVAFTRICAAARQ